MRIDPRNVAAGVAGAIALPAAVLSVLGFLDDVAWPFEVAAAFRASYAVALAGGAAVLALARRRALALLALACAIADAVVVLPHVVPGPREAGQGPVVRVCLANLRAANRRHEDVLAWVRETDADVVVLEEVNARWAAALAPLDATHPTRMVRPREDDFGIGLWTRLPAVQLDDADLGASDVPAPVARLEAGGGATFTLVAVHALPPVSSAYAAVRAAQLRGVARIATHAEGPVVVLGDLNAAPWSPALATCLASGDLRNAAEGFGWRPTWPTASALVQVPLDHVLVSPGIGVRSLDVGPDLGSDHFPVVADLVLRAVAVRQGRGGPGRVRRCATPSPTRRKTSWRGSPRTTASRRRRSRSSVA